MQRVPPPVWVIALALALALALATAGFRVHAESGSRLERFLSRPDEGRYPYRAMRRLEAGNLRLKKSAWLEVDTAYAPGRGLSYRVIDTGGSDVVLRRVLLPALEAERKALAMAGARHALTRDNYIFLDGADSPVRMRPRRKDALLVDGRLTLGDDGDLIAIEGVLAKPPSFWTTEVTIVREYARLSGFRVPVRMESIAMVRFAGRSTFSMTYDYLEINRRPIGHDRGATFTGDPR